MIPTLHTKRLTLRPPTPADEAAFARFYATSDVEVGAYRRRDAAEARAKLHYYIAEWARNGFGMWVLDLDGEMIGGCGICWDADMPSHELTWFLFADHRGKGYAREASEVAIAWGYDVAGFDPVETYIRDQNTPARALAARLGGKVVRRRTFPDGVTRDIFALPHPSRPAQTMPDRLMTDRLVLSKPAQTDLAAYRGYATSRRSAFVGGPYDEVKAFDKFSAMIGHWPLRGFGRYVLVNRASGAPIGHVGPLQMDEAEAPEMTWTLWRDEHEGAGYAYEAARAVCDLLEAQPVSDELVAHIEAGNKRSRLLAERLGAQLDEAAPQPAWLKNSVTYRWEARA